MKPKVAIVGRPNVGKSALFNAIIGRRSSIVDEQEGVTRDRLYKETQFFSNPFTLIDTGGIDLKGNLPFQKEIIIQAEIAIEEADYIIFVVDAGVGLTELDKEVVKTLFKAKKEVVLAINKVDNQDKEHQAFLSFYSLGIKKMVSTSALHRFHIAELLEAVFDKHQWQDEQEEEQNRIKIALVGRTNTGKSTLLNHLLDEERSLVSSIAGTTRDTIDVMIERNNKNYQLIDTAGIRKKNKEKDVVDKFAYIRTKEAIKQADICLLLIDITSPMTFHDRKIFSFIEESKTACILLFNKWDLIKDVRIEHCKTALLKNYPFLSFYPSLFVSAKIGKNLDQIYPLIDEVYKQYIRNIPTSQINDFIEKAMQRTPPPMIKGKRFRVYYATQTSSAPLRFIVFVNYPHLNTSFYKRYLLNAFKKRFGLLGCPVYFQYKGKINNH